MKKKLKKSVIAGIEKMITYVLAHPEELDQNNFPYNGEPACDTPFCAAGHIIACMKPKLFKVMLEGFRPNGRGWADNASELIGVSTWKMSTLFGAVRDWPEQFVDMYRKADRYKSKATVAKYRARAFAARWQHFIAYNGEGLLEA